MWQRARGSQFPPATRRAILTRDPACRLHLPGCTTVSTQADHITPTSLGGSHDQANGRGVCASCHQQATNEQSATARRASLARARYPKAKPPGLR